MGYWHLGPPPQFAAKAGILKRTRGMIFPPAHIDKKAAEMTQK